MGNFIDFGNGGTDYVTAWPDGGCTDQYMEDIGNIAAAFDCSEKYIQQKLCGHIISHCHILHYVRQAAWNYGADTMDSAACSASAEHRSIHDI